MNYSYVKKKLIYFDESYVEKESLDTFSPESIKSTKCVFGLRLLT